MGKTAYFVMFIFIIIIVLPVLLVKGIFFFSGESGGNQILIKVYNDKSGKVVTMELEKYLKGVVAAEMPAAYNLEALKAQAVAARTYTLKQLPAFGGNGSGEHPGADICTDYRHSQAWLSEADMKKKWGFMRFFYYWSRISRAVEQTKGKVLVYNGDLIDAVYHSNGGGMTEDAVNVWGRVTPYLKGVSSPYDKENAEHYQQQFKFKLAKFDQKLGINLEDEIKSKTIQNDNGKLLVGNKGSEFFDVLKKSKSGRVLKMKISDKEFTGQEVREKLGLPSTNFTFSIQQDNVITTVIGNGHGVGMSQEGADGYADHNYSYSAILKHYYQGTEIVNINNLK